MKANVVTVFGGSAPGSGDRAYRSAESLGRNLGEVGFSVATGGYVGTMEAVSKGAAASGGHVIGVTCEQIERWRRVSPNPWVSEEIRVSTLLERVYRLIEIGEALVALPGGLGTLSEIALAWSLMQTEEISSRPFVLVGEFWQRIMGDFIATANGYLAPKDIELLTFKDGVDDAVDYLVRRLRSHA
ncbi:MAG: LOG family protein [Anaerolineales bacterium]|nr:LOG family protein [Anaerolineales bacterium]